MKIIVIDGPNLNILGLREKNLYGGIKLEEIQKDLKESATKAGFEIDFFQSNLEGEIVDRIQECYGTANGIIINPAAYTHSSIAIRDALLAVGLPCVEVHLSNIYAREEFRKKSYISPICTGTITGLGPLSYHLGLIAMINILNEIKSMQEDKS